jgi:hypothetical protein
MNYKGIKINGKKIDLHRKIMSDFLGYSIPRELVVHHINGNMMDNRIENLQLMSIQEHGRLHHPPQPKRKRIRPWPRPSKHGTQSKFLQGCRCQQCWDGVKDRRKKRIKLRSEFYNKCSEL